MIKTSVVWTKTVTKQLFHLPDHILEKFQAWTVAIETVGLGEVRKTSGFHDEPLKGKRKGQRSVRLSRSYRAIYIACRR